jgi:nucleoside-diphosphate-sugar epimerase
MRILVTGGTGVVGEATLIALLRRGHEVRVVTRRPDRAWSEWPDRLEVHGGDVSDPESLRGAADGCHLVLHMAGIVAEELPGLTFESVNVAGTVNMLNEAIRSRVRRFVLISSLGADRGASPYHLSKKRAEAHVRSFKGDWLILRPGNVYGPGDQVISLLLKFVRSLPAIPVIDGGEQPFQPMWHEDLGEAIATAVEREDLKTLALDLAGPEQTTMNDLIDRFGEITGRKPLRVPFSADMTKRMIRLAEWIGVEIPLDEGQITMLQEENVLRGKNGFAELGITPVGLDEGLRRLADALPENLPSDGVGPLREKRFWAEIEESRFQCNELFEIFCRKFGEIMPIDVGVEPGTNDRIAEGATITMKLPLRGNIQVRVEKIDHHSITLATLEGHPIAGTVRFSFDQTDSGIRFQVQVLDRSGNALDLLAMETLGRFLQDSNWITVVDRVVEESGGRAIRGVQHMQQKLKGDEAEAVEHWVDDMVAERKKEERERQIEN